MFYFDKLKTTVAEAIERITGAFDWINSPEFEAEMRARYPEGGSIYPCKLGTLEGDIRITALANLRHASWLVDSAEPDIAWGERCAALCESLGIDDDNIAMLEMLCKRNCYLTEHRHLTQSILSAAGEVQDSERELEQDQTVEALEKAGFLAVELDDFEGWERGNQRVTIESKHRPRSIAASPRSALSPARTAPRCGSISDPASALSPSRATCGAGTG